MQLSGIVLATGARAPLGEANAEQGLSCHCVYIMVVLVFQAPISDRSCSRCHVACRGHVDVFARYYCTCWQQEQYHHLRSLLASRREH
jgi:hypothetical protein